MTAVCFYSQLNETMNKKLIFKRKCDIYLSSPYLIKKYYKIRKSPKFAN